MSNQTNLSRRAMLRLSAGSLLALGLWPGALRAADGGGGGEFTFIVLNDLHYINEKDGEWLAKVMAKIKADTPGLKLGLMAGDFTDDGTAVQLAATRDLFAQLGVPWYGVIGNHDYLKATDRRPYEEIFPGRLNYWVEFQGWQIMGLDTTEGLKAAKTKVGEATLRWVDETLPKLDKKHPLMLISHFPLGAGITNRPLNADDLLERFKEYNLQAAFCGHYHAFTERPRGAAMLTTNRCCSLTKFNHDKSKEKGYFLCQAKAGQIQRAFVEVEVPARPAADQGKQT